MILGYCREGALRLFPTAAEQERELYTIGAKAFYCDRAGFFGKTPELERAIENAKKGDVIAITRPYCIARSTRQVLALIERLGRKGVGLKILDTPIDTSTTTGRMILGSAPPWSLGMSPVRSAMQDLLFIWRRSPGAATRGAPEKRSQAQR
ncbi:MAG TPA: recombinase family protein [Roseiarcus sp.]|nr:recombinase family protein [Roseiarcus sp.]